MADVVPIPTEPRSPGKALRYAARALRLNCPVCGDSPIFLPLARTRSLTGWMTPLDGCPICRYRYERESGYFLLATWAVNYGLVGLAGLAAGFLLEMLAGFSAWRAIAVVLPAMAVASVALVRHSKSLWIAFDHFWDPHRHAAPGPAREERARGRSTQRPGREEPVPPARPPGQANGR